MVCKRCGHALGTNNAVCPNCGAFMTKEQLQERREINGANNAYMNRLYEINKKNAMNKLESNTHTKNDLGYALFIGICLVIIALIIAFILLRK